MCRLPTSPQTQPPPRPSLPAPLQPPSSCSTWLASAVAIALAVPLGACAAAGPQRGGVMRRAPRVVVLGGDGDLDLYLHVA